jgi:predicted nucleotidyltransferase component of viral defense system
VIPKAFITDWSRTVPWQTNEQVEQDLIISRALIAIFSDEFLQESLAFRGGTALNKLYLEPAPRYSEDIDLVQVHEGPIKPILSRIDEVITFFEEKRVVKVKANNNTLLYRFESEFPPKIRLRLKIEINCREHFNVLGWNSLPYSIQNDWFTGHCKITTYHLDELLGTKVRALYQRKKGRDLFDLYYVSQNKKIDFERVIHCYNEYMKFSVGQSPSKKEFLMNMSLKKESKQFASDMKGLIHPNFSYDPSEAFSWLEHSLIPLMK